VSQMSRSIAIDVRHYRQDDESGVLDLLASTLGGGPAGYRSPEFFRWKHLESPFGRSYMLVAEADDRIVGLRAFMRWRFRSGDQLVRAVRAVDTATHPEHQGQGIFSRLTRRAVDELRKDVDLVFNTPNQNSLPGYLKMGWRIAARIPVDVRVRRPIPVMREFRRLRSTAAPTRPRPAVRAESAEEALSDPSVVTLLAEAGESGRRLVTPLSGEYLGWRYASAPLLGYRAVREHIGGALAGMALFRVRPRGRLWETTVAEAIVRSGDVRTARRLLGRVVRAASVDHVSCRFPPGSAPARGARAAGFLRAPGGLGLVVNPLREVQPDPAELDSWGLSLGDLEVF
jgi:GNAT superfamily N-acetyltransferase